MEFEWFHCAVKLNQTSGNRYETDQEINVFVSTWNREHQLKVDRSRNVEREKKQNRIWVSSYVCYRFAYIQQMLVSV